MGFRFRRRITIGPGFRLNLSKSGVSASVGRRGLWATLGHGKARATVGLPGTGLSYTEEQRIGAAPGHEGEQATSSGGARVLFWLVLLALVAVAIGIWG
jgi:hypothetical protein